MLYYLITAFLYIIFYFAVCPQLNADVAIPTAQYKPTYDQVLELLLDNAESCVGPQNASFTL